MDSFIGEDEASGLPSRYLGQLGIESSGTVGLGSYRAFAEYAGTTCQFYESSSRPNCAYNNGIYQTGYRYKGRSIGHSADNDADVVSAGFQWVGASGDPWQFVARYAKLNTEGAADVRNSLTPTPADFLSLEASHTKSFDFGVVEVGVGATRFEDSVTGIKQDDSRLFVRLRMPF